MAGSGRFFLIAAGCGILALSGAEIGLRACGFGHPLLYHASPAGHEPNASQTVRRFGKTTHYNSLGLRGPKTTAFPSSGAIRILSLGDSVANGGTMIADRQTYPAKLEARLQRDHWSVEVLNASAGGWAPANEDRWLREHGTFGAQVLILEINEKDLDEAFVDSDILDNNVSFPSHPPILAIQAVTVRYMLPRLGLLKPPADPGSIPGAFNDQNTGDVLAAIGDIADQARAADAALIIFYWDLRAKSRDPKVIAGREALFTWAKSQGIPIVRPQINNRPDSSSLYRDAVHPNAKGNELIAKTIADFLEASGIMKGAASPSLAGKAATSIN